MKIEKNPPIQYLTVLDAAARHLSFKDAGSELSVSGPAVAQQIKAFEHWLGRPLFIRHTRALSLTDEGEYYAKVAESVMKIHKRGYSEYIRRFEKQSMTISAPFFVAQELLMPNYLKFKDISANTELRIETRMSLVDFSNEAIDAAIRFGDGHWPDVDCIHLCDAYVSPVCSQSYLESHPHSPTELSKIFQQRLIYAYPEINEWGPMLWDKGEKPLFENIVCDSYISSIKAASDGLGIALGIFPAANNWINQGRVVLPYNVEINTGKSYWFVCPKNTKEKPENQALYCWVKEIFDDIPELQLDRESSETLSSIILEAEGDG